MTRPRRSAATDHRPGQGAVNAHLGLCGSCPTTDTCLTQGGAAGVCTTPCKPSAKSYVSTGGCGTGTRCFDFGIMDGADLALCMATCAKDSDCASNDCEAGTCAFPSPDASIPNPDAGTGVWRKPGNRRRGRERRGVVGSGGIVGSGGVVGETGGSPDTGGIQSEAAVRSAPAERWSSEAAASSSPRGSRISRRAPSACPPRTWSRNSSRSAPVSCAVS